MVPFAVKADQREISVSCPGCVGAKNQNPPGELPPWGVDAYGRDEGLEEVTFIASTPLDQETGIAECPRGHRHPWEREIEAVPQPA